MNINRHNYEEYFLLYADRELSAEEKLQVEAFAEQHPDLKAELEMLLLTIQPVDGQVAFNEKENLYRTEDTDSLVNMTNFESWFVQYTDDELTNEEKAETEKFVYNHPELQSDFELLQKTRLSADSNIRFPDKERLYRTDRERRQPVVISLWIRYAVAAALILIAGFTWLRQQKTDEVSQPAIASVDTSRQQKINTGTNPEAQPNTNLVAATTPGLQDQDLTAKDTGKKNQEKEIYRQTEAPVILAKNDPQEQPAKSQETFETTPSIPQAQVENTTGSPDITLAAINPKPGMVIDRPVIIEPGATPNVVYASNAAEEDYVYVPGRNIVRKTPLKGILRKAGRFIEKNNPLSADREKGGVFTASNDQQ